MAVILPSSLQQDVQSNLPIIPNNGNPGGAYNMPRQGQPQQSAAPEDPYAWLKPSPYMEQVKNILFGQQEEIRRRLFEISNPQQKQDFYVGVREGDFHVVPLNDYGLPMNENPGEPFLTYPLPNEVTNMPQYRPILPGE